ncbi:fimbrial biogenesis chaperone [Stenotrophomonas maltophilia]|uniref:fimbrial biogenesis chaperone n=1 Tax=Stenotrophomonas maltophilia TaxID=40324 RepID=UPI00138FC82A|nr:molecular chaperone [Stenotrophomonas maltophilia]
MDAISGLNTPRAAHRHRRRRLTGTALLLWGCALASAAWGQVSMPGTRVVYPGKQAEVVVPLKNVSASPVLVQAWVSDGDADQRPENSGAPFVLAPPILRLSPNKDANLRIRQIPAKAPADTKEHLYWLSILAVPPSREESENKLELGVRSRYKLLFRPVGLPPPPENRMEGVTLSVRRGQGNASLVFQNGTAYYLNLGRVVIVAGGAERELENPFAPPFGEASIALPDDIDAGVLEVRFSWLDDNGTLHPETRQVEGYSLP